MYSSMTMTGKFRSNPGLAAVLFAGALLLGGAGAWHWHAARTLDRGATPIKGGDGGGWPRADAATEGFDVQALQAAAGLARGGSAGGLLVSRHGHLVLEDYFGGADADSLVAGGEFSDTLLVLALGVAVDRYGLAQPATPGSDAGRLSAAIATASGLTYPQFLSRHLWQRLNAAPAQCSGSRVSARAVDWLRIAELLLHDGRFEGTQVVPASWVQQMRAIRAGAQSASGIYHASSAVGAEPFASDDTFFMRGPGDTHLWLIPRLDLAVLAVAGSAEPRRDETRLPNAVIRSLRDRPPSAGVNLGDLVPGH